MRIFWRILAALVLIAAVAGIGFYAYSLGMTQGLAQKVAPATSVTVPGPYMMYPWHPFFGFGWGPLGCLIPLFLLFLVFGSFRAIFWHGPMGWRRHMMHHGHWNHDENDKDKDLPPFFAEWHRRAHGEPEEEPVKK
jgi:hypothetical protein